MKPPGPSPVDIQSHLYESFLQGCTTDIKLHIHGSSWEATYSLHRVVLIQSGYFHSLFTNGFIESSYRGDALEIVFDDVNITRAAFELCISRLYGGGPPLFISPALIPTQAHPLTPSYPTLVPPAEIPPGNHPATPRFLLSLLATALYLQMPSLAAEALNSVLSTIGPHTVIQYLDFALGRPIGPQEDGEPEAALGLERVATMIRGSTGKAPSIQTTKSNPDLDNGDAASMSDTISRSTSSSSDDEESPLETISHYGNISNKIGEACACWLARWTDILPLEVEADLRERNGTTLYNEQYNVPVIWGRGGLSARWVQALIASDVLFVRNERARYDFARTVVELRRAHGIDAEEEEVWDRMFAEAIYYENIALEDAMAISSDVSPITQRHFVPLSILQAAHWNDSLLKNQITVKPTSSSPSPSFMWSPHSHSPVKSLWSIPVPRSSTATPILPVSLRHRAVPSPSPAGAVHTQKDKELGIVSTTAEILSRLPSLSVATRATEKKRAHFLVSQDGSLRLGDNGGIEGESMEELFDVTSPGGTTRENSDHTVRGHKAASEASFFGLRSDRYSGASSCIAADSSGKLRWSPYPPYRFSVEFWDVSALREKSRLYSHTIAYAGSFWNVYVQVVRKKGVQLGVYIHRQSSIEPIPPPSAPSSISNIEHNDIAEALQAKTRGFPAGSPTSPHFSPSIHPPSRSSTPVTITPGSPPGQGSSTPSALSAPGPNTIPATSVPVTPTQTYRDPRALISAYFTVAVASATGASVTKFNSGPDTFSVSQSWGWKSSSLRTEEYIEVGGGATGVAARPESSSVEGRMVSLRATVMLGLV